MRSATTHLLWLVMVLAGSLCTLTSLADEKQEPAGQDPKSDKEVAKKDDQAAAKKPAGADETSGSDAAKSGAKKEGDKDSDKDEAPSLKRPDTPPRVPDPREFDVAPDKNGLVRFNFYGQAWPDVLQWLANISDFSLDWKELPSDYINVTTPRSCTVVETRDLFNRLLLDRGYTMVEQGRVLSVVKISKLDPSLLPRVQDESELMDLSPHSFVKITFKLPDQLAADKAAADIKPLLSPNAKVAPLLATNRILVIDAVANLREVSRLVNAEHAAATGNTVPREFLIRYARAGQVADQVMILLGLDPNSRRTPQELQIEQQRLQLFQQMQQKGTDVAKYLRKGDGPTVFVAVNDRTNSILVNAPPAEMRIIERSIEQLDVPSASATGMMTGRLSMEKYQLVTITPQSIVTTLETIGDLDSRTRLKTDSEAKIVFAHATAGDHQKIKAMIDRLDGTGRELAVIWLRRLPAKAVAISLTNLLVGKEEEKESTGRSFFYYPSSRDRKAEKPKSSFRVDADVEQNRLLLWANETEMQEVRSFLEKLGEVPGRSGNPHTVRFLSPRRTEETTRTLDQLRRAWKGPNKLEIDVPEGDLTPESDENAPASKSPPNDPRVAERRRTFQVASAVLQLPATSNADDPSAVMPVPGPEDDRPENNGPGPENNGPNDNTLRQVADDERLERNAQDAAPVTITLTPDGRIMLQSDDTMALDEIEDVIASLTPPAPNFKVFYLKHAIASMVTLNLEEYFAEEADFDTDENWMRAWYGLDFEKGGKGDGGLGQQRKMRFIYDFDTNSVLVADASPSQLSVVETLIELYDVPPSEDSLSARRFQMFPLEYSQAEDVAKIIKEVFRDLLSSKDKDFDGRANEKEQRSQTRDYYRIVSPGGSDDNKKPTKVRASFEGALSVGVDMDSNAVIVSAQEEWMPTIAEMIEFLDKNAVPKTTVAVRRIPAQVNTSTLHEALQEIVNQSWVGKRRQTKKPAPKATSSARKGEPVNK